MPDSWHNTTQGKVYDAEAKAPLAFVNILLDGVMKGVITDDDGYKIFSWR